VNDKEIQDAVHSLVAQTLGLDVEEVTPDSRFFTDLGGESIDLLDLAFRCEKHFGIKVQFDQLLPKDMVPNAQGQLSPAAMETLGRRFPNLDTSRFKGTNQLNLMQELLIISVITDFIRERLAAVA
jgi:acyl carrier protein